MEKYWAGVARNGCDHLGHKVNGRMDRWIELIFHADANPRKLSIIYFLAGYVQKMGMGL